MSRKERKHQAPPRYDEAFKAGAVQMVTEQGRASREVAREPGICIDTLRSWLKAAGAPSPGQADRQNRDAKRLRELETEVRALRKKMTTKRTSKFARADRTAAGHQVVVTYQAELYL